MRVTRRVAAGAVFDEHTLDALAGNVRQLVLVNEGHLGVLRLRRICEDAAERQNGVKQRTEVAFHGVLCSGREDERQAEEWLQRPRAAVAHICQACCRTAVPWLLSIMYRQSPSAPRRRISLAEPPRCTCLPSGPVPSIDQSSTIWAISPATNTWRALASSGRPSLRSRSSSAAISVCSVMVRPSFAMNTASGAYRPIIALTLPELNRSRSVATMPSGLVGSV